MAAAGVRTTKGLYFTFTLLCLVCLASSLIDKDLLEKLKDTLQQSQQTLDRVKAEQQSDFVPALQHMNEYMNLMDQMAALVKKTSTGLSDDFPPVDRFLENIKGFMEKTKTNLERENEELGANIEELEKGVRKNKKLVEFLEENQAEL